MTEPRRIYLDHAATTPVDPRVVETISRTLGRQLGNASSLHGEGRLARRILEQARRTMAAALKVRRREIVFTSGGTEANNLAILGAARARRRAGAEAHLVVSAVEHHSVLAPARVLADQGWRLSLLGVDRHARVDPDDVRRVVGPGTALVSVMTANNEVGTVQPIEAIAAHCHALGVPFHTDAVQAIGWVERLLHPGVSLLSASAHKFHGPMGAGFLWVSDRTVIDPILAGGHHERGLRAGTENVPAIAGMATALELVSAAGTPARQRTPALADLLQRGIEERFPGVASNTPAEGRLPGIRNLAFPGIEGAAFVLALDHLGVAVSMGAACTSGRIEPSHVLAAMGLAPGRVRGSIRFSLGRETTEEEVMGAIEAVDAARRGLDERTRRPRRPASSEAR